MKNALNNNKKSQNKSLFFIFSDEKNLLLKIKLLGH